MTPQEIMALDRIRRAADAAATSADVALDAAVRAALLEELGADCDDASWQARAGPLQLHVRYDKYGSEAAPWVAFVRGYGEAWHVVDGRYGVSPREVVEAALLALEAIRPVDAAALRAVILAPPGCSVDDPTVPGSIPGLLRRCSPVVVVEPSAYKGLTGVVVAVADDGLLMVGFNRPSISSLLCFDPRDLALDLCNEAGQHHAALYLWNHKVNGHDYGRVIAAAMTGSADVGQLRAAVLHAASVAP